MIIGKDIQNMLKQLEEEQSAKEGASASLYKENRCYRRSRVVWEAKLKMFFNDVTLKGEVREVHGVVRDISANGAKVDLQENIQERAGLELHIPKMGVFPCNIVWQDGTRVGIQFTDSPDTVFSHLARVLPKV